MIYSDRYKSPMGEIVLASDGLHLTGLYFIGNRFTPPELELITPNHTLDIFHMTFEWLDTYFGGRIPTSKPMLLPAGSPFQLAVWSQLMEIPYGTTISYGSLAQKLGTKSARAVGSAVGRNPISLIIPCHRVINANGEIGGYACGTELKCRLLKLEKAI